MREKLHTFLGPCLLGLVLGFALALLVPLLREQTDPWSDPPPRTAPAPEREGRININTADAAQLQELPGIGEALSERILRHREQYGPFQTIWELTAVDGLGEGTAEKLIPYVTISEKE